VWRAGREPFLKRPVTVNSVRGITGAYLRPVGRKGGEAEKDADVVCLTNGGERSLGGRDHLILLTHD